MKLTSCKFRKVFHFFITVLLLLTALVAYSQTATPGGGVQPYAWFRSEDLSSSTWTSYYGTHTLSPSGTAPVVVSNVFNGRPALRFKNGSYLADGGWFTGLASNYELFIVYKDTTGLYPFTLFDISESAVASFSLTSSEVKVSIVGSGFCSSISAHTNLVSNASNSISSPNLFSIKSNGSTSYNYTTFLNNTDSSSSLSYTSFCLGSPQLQLGAGLNGYISEVIVYNTLLNTAQRKIVQNYLALKFSLPSIPSVKYSSALYNENLFASSTPYSTNIAGIGMEDAGDTANYAVSDFLTIRNSSPTSGNYFLCAHNDSATTFESVNNPPNVKKIQRTWASAIKGTNTMNINFTIPQSILSSSINTAYQVPVLLLNSTSNFTTGTRVIAMNSSGSDFTINAPVDSGDYISFGVLNQYPYLSYYPDEVGAIGEAYLNYNKIALSDSVLTIDNPRSLAAGDYLIVGENGGTLDFTTSAYSSYSGIERVNRIWKVNQTGSVGNVDVTMDTTRFGTLPTGKKNRLLLISSDSIFDSTFTKVFGMVRSGAKFKAYNLTIPNGYYISFAAGQEVITNPKSLSAVFKQSTSDLSGLTTKQLCIVPDSSFDFAGACSSTLSNSTLSLTFNTGNDYPFGNNAFTDTVRVQIKGFKNYTGTGTAYVTYNATLTTNQTNPEIVKYFTITNDYDSVKIYKVTITSFAAPSTALIKDSLVLTASINETYTVNIPITTTSPIENQSYTSNKNVAYTFRWSTDHCNAPSYQFQLLRLYNNDSLTAPGTINTNPDTIVTATIDWNQALTIETDSQNITLTLAEGTGYYAWRVRPIGNVYAGGVADSRNWGNWSTDNIGLDSGTISLNSTNPSSYQNSVFYYVQFDSCRNFIYTRTFTEGPKVHEGITYANGLMQVKQSQQHIPSNALTGSSNNGEILAGQTVYDYSGRPALESMMAPVFDTSNTLGYRTGLLMHHADTLYAAQHFDTDSRIYTPQPVDPVNGGYVNSYYSNNNTDITIPSADNYPFSRTIYDNEGTGRVIESGGVGDTLQVGTGHTVRILYGSVSDDELIRVFGDEAPDASTVYKKAVTDQNNVTSITYIDKSGNTLATCLSHNSYKSNLTPLASLDSAAFSVKDTITQNTPYENGLLGTKALDFFDTTQLTIKYEITPTIISSSCGSYCSTCGYLLTIKVIDLSDSTKNHVIDTSIAPGTAQNKPCSSSIDSLNSVTYSLAPGKYVVERIIQLDSTAANAYANKIISAINDTLQPMVDSIQSYLTASNVSGLVSYLTCLQKDTASVGIEVYSDSGNTLYSSINHSYNHTPLTTLQNGQKVGIITTCCTITIPVIFPAFNPCSTSWSSTTIASYFVHQFDSAITGGISAASANSMYGQYNASYFATLINNMLTDPVVPYNCDSLWNCLQSVMRSYGMTSAGVSKSTLTTGLGSNPPNWAQSMASNGPSNTSIDIVDQFLECAGKRYAGYTTDTLLLRTKPYRYFYYNRGDSTTSGGQGRLMCENSFCNYQPINANMQIQTTFTYPPCSIDLCARDTTDETDPATSRHYETLTIGGHVLNQMDYYVFSKCIQETNEASDTTTIPVDSINYPAMQSQNEALCESQCANKYQYFYSTLQSMNTNTYLGPQLQQNGNFASHTGGWTVTGGTATIDTINGDARLDVQPSGQIFSTATLTAGVTYELSFTVTSYGTDTIKVFYNGSTITDTNSNTLNPIVQAYYSNYTIGFKPTTSGVVSFQSSVISGDSSYLYDVSIRQVMPALNWQDQDLCCAARELVDYCKQSCTLTLITECTPSKIVGLGTQAEFNRWSAIMYGTFDIQLQPSGGSCATNYEAVKLNLQSYYEFNDNFNDGSGNGLNGTGSSTATFGVDKSGMKGWAGLFDGAAAYVDCGTNSRNITNTVTVSAWINTTAATTQTVAAQQAATTGSSGYQLQVNSSGYAVFTGYDGSGTFSATSSTTVNDGHWHFLTGVCNNNLWQIYVDSILVGTYTSTTTTAVLTSTASFDIGAYNGTSNFFNGSIEQVGVYNSALNQHQITDIYTSTLAPYNQTPAGCLNAAPYQEWQVAPTQWINNISDIYETSDGGSMYAYQSYISFTGDTIAVVRLNANGIVESIQRFFIPSIGGAGFEGATYNRFKLTSEGGYLFGGYVNYTGSDYDYWVAKFDANGTLKFSNTFGGYAQDGLSDLNETSDKGCILGGFSASDSGKNKTTPNYGGTSGLPADYWIVKIDSSGNYQWDSTYGGSGDDYLQYIQQTSDGGYILGGYSDSPISGDKYAPNIGENDFWIIKLKSDNTRQWEKTYGGYANDNFVSMQILPGNGYILGGTSSSGEYSPTSTFTASPSFGSDDYWALKIDNNGNYQWDKAYGGASISGNVKSYCNKRWWIYVCWFFWLWSRRQ